MDINYSKTIDISSDSGEITEPVTLQEAKDFIRLEGFIDEGDSTSTEISDFDFDDELITELITTAREHIEERAWITLIPKTLKSLINNSCGMIEIPRGPISSITSLKDTDDNDLTYTLSGFLGDFPNLKSPCDSEMIMIYEAGYGNTDCPTLPKAIKTDLLRLVTFLYLNRETIDKFQMTHPFSRNTGII